MQKLFHGIAYFLATCAGAGLSPYAPGTVGSLVAALALFFLPPFSPKIFWPLLVVIFFLGLWSSYVIAKQLGEKDPSCIVIDEWVGMWFVLPFVPKTVFWYVGAFCLFRLFDIIKPWPISAVEKNAGGWGIMLDDIVAGFLALTVFFLLFSLVSKRQFLFL